MGLSLGRVFAVVGSFFVGVFTGQWQFFALAVSNTYQSQAQKRMRARAIADYNARLQDRLEMAEPDPTAPRSRAYGRVRYVEGIRYRWSQGDRKERLTMIVSHAGHRIDAFEQWYLNDVAVTLDANGWVQTQPYAKVNVTQTSVAGTLNSSGAASVTLAGTIATGSTVRAYQRPVGGATRDTSTKVLTVSMTGNVAAISGGDPSQPYWLTYDQATADSKVRIRTYLGTDTQNVGADLAAESPYNITATRRFAGIALSVVDCYFDTDVFPQGRPTPAPVFRGARVYDPRKDSTVPGGSGSHRIDDPSTWRWSRNPALVAYDYARWAYGWGLAASDIMTPQEVAAEADFCDQDTEFTLRKADGTTSTVTLPRYVCDIVLKADADPNSRAANMSAIMETMAGADGWDGGTWRFRAGRAKTASFTVDDTWLMNRVRGAGKPDTDPVIRVANAFTREQRINRVTGQCVDPDKRYQALPFPAYEDPVLVAAKGPRVEEVNFEGVAHIAHAQHLASVIIRQAQSGTRMEMLCGIRAYRPQLFDVGTILLPRHGMDEALGKTMEVIGRKWSPDTGIKLQLAEIGAGIFDPVSELKGRDPAPDSTLRPPWALDSIAGVSAVAGESTLVDNSIVTRTIVTWTAYADDNVRQGGRIEVQYIEALYPLPAGDWPSQLEPGNATQCVLVGLLTNRVYLVRVRAVQQLPLVRGPWSVTASVRVGPRRAPRVFRQNAAPTGDVVQDDIWFDTNDGNHSYIYSGSAWVSTQDDGIADALATAAAAQATADGKIDTFWQTTPPSGGSEGDIWFDTDDGNRQYRRTSGTWVVAADTRIGTAINNAATAQATADGKVRTFVVASAPTATALGDLWLDSDDGFRMYRWSGSAWVDVRDTGIAAALSTAAAAQATADGKIDTFWQTTPPSGGSEGDIWFDTDDGNRQYRRTSGTWVVAADTRIGTAISNAATAQATADGKVRTYVQDDPPTASALGDLWMDSNDGFRMYRWSGSAWVDVRDTGIAAALSTAAAAQATADGKIDTFWQNSAPSAASEGDIWFDTNDGNKQYRRTSGAWVLAADTRIGTAISNAATAQATADGKVRTYVQNSAPAATAVGDLWLDANDGFLMYRWSGSAWVAVQDSRIAQALNAAADAQATADGKIDTFWQTTAPAVASEGDIWFDTDAGNQQYRRTGGVWVLAADTRIGQAISDAADAQATADGKVTTFVQASAPVAEGVGDFWLDSDDGNKLYRWNGSAWAALPIGTGGLAPGAATTLVSDSDALSYSFVSGTAGFEYRVQRLLPVSWTNTTGATVTVELAAQIGGKKSSGPGQVWVDAASATSALTSGVFSGLSDSSKHTEVTAGYDRYTHTDSLAVAPGATIYFALTVYVYSALGTTTNFSGEGNIRIVVILR